MSRRAVATGGAALRLESLVALLLGGCTSPVAEDVPVPIPVDEYELPPRDPSLDPADVRTGNIIASDCSFSVVGAGFEQYRGRVEWATLDVFLGPFLTSTSDLEASAQSRLTAQDSSALESLGVRVLYRFNVRAVRGRVLLSGLERLILEIGEPITVWDVPEASRFDIPWLNVYFDPPLRDEPVLAFSALGGRVTAEVETPPIVIGAIPDRSIPALRSRPDVRYLWPGGDHCPR